MTYRRLLLVLGCLILLVPLFVACGSAPSTAIPAQTLTDFNSPEELKTRFNQDAGEPRLILLVSPTWGTCLEGARWVQSEILAKNPTAKLQVYVVWLVSLPGDRRSAWDADIMPDPRVAHFWDASRIAGPWFARNIEGADGFMWDTYLLYGPDATWNQAPGPLLSSGGTIIDTSTELRDKLMPLLKLWYVQLSEDGMNEAALTDLAATVAERLCGRHEHVCVALIRHLAAGQPVSAAHLAADIAMEEPAVSAILQEMSDVAYDGDGQVVGFGLSLVPTAHQFTINSQTLYTWCALDTFLYTALLGQPSEVVSHCPVMARPITLAMTPEGVAELSPVSSVVSLVIPDGSIADCRRSAFCNHGHFFASAEAGATWLDDRPNGIILSMNDAHRLGQLLAGHRLLLANGKWWFTSSDVP